MNAKITKYIIDIVPLTKIPLTRNQSFSYLSEIEIPTGTLVGVPLFKRKVEGIVIGTRNDFHRLGKIELKKVDKIIEEKFLSEKQLKLAVWMSDYYISPLGVVMKGFVPKRAVSRKQEAKSRSVNKKIILTREQQNAVNKLTSCLSLAACRFLLYGSAASGKTEVYIHSIIKIRENNSEAQFLILVPEQTLTPQALERYGAYFKLKEMVLLTSNLTKGQYYSNWMRIKSGEAKIIIGTRMAVFAPFKNLGLIVIDEEQDMSYKQWDMNPRYDARTVAKKLGKLYNCPIVFGSATPSIISYWRALNKELTLVKLPALKLEAVSGKQQATSKNINTLTAYCLPLVASLVDMRKERWAKNYSTISKKLKSEIAYAIKNKLQTILFINRQGMSSFSVCFRCKTVLKCPDCERALVYNSTGEYSCIHCSYKTSILPHCSKCNGMEFKNIGLGTQKIEREINNLFPGARVARIDSQSIKERNYQERIYQEFKERRIDILIGTQMISKGWDLPNVSLVGIIDIDNMLTFPDFSTEEKAFQTVVQLAGRVNRPGAKYPGVVIIQTFQPENKFIKIIAEQDFEAFYKKEIKERQELSIPPFGKFIRLVFQDYNSKKVEKEIERVFNYLTAVKNLSVTWPQDAFVSKIQGRYRKIIIIKIKDNVIPLKVTAIVRKLGTGWLIDVDPISII